MRYGIAFGINYLQLTRPCRVQISRSLCETTYSSHWAALSVLLRPNSLISAAVNWNVVEVVTSSWGFLWIVFAAGAWDRMENLRTS
jgi:hypothetical protein